MAIKKVKTAKALKNAIKKAGGLSNFSSYAKKTRHPNCPSKFGLVMKRKWKQKEVDKITSEEINVGYILGVI